MTRRMSKATIVRNLSLVAEWLRVKHPKRRYVLDIAGGAALTFLGCKSLTIDVDVVSPRALPREIQEAADVVAKARGLGPGWLGTGVGKVVSLIAKGPGLPSYFSQNDATIDVAPNLTIRVVARQTLVSLKLLAASPSERKHIDDLKALTPTPRELELAHRFVLAFDSSAPRREDLEIVLTELRDKHVTQVKNRQRRR